MSKKSKQPQIEPKTIEKPVVANIIENNQQVSLNAEQFGIYVVQNYETLQFSLVKNFISYREQHAMGPTIDKLKQGLDEVSCTYIDLHERLLDLARVSSHVLVKKEFIWTQEDQRLFDNYHALKANGTVPLLNQVNLEWGSSITNHYGMYDIPHDKIAAVANKAVIDVGGYIGDSLSLFRALFGQSKIYSFEPSKA